MADQSRSRHIPGAVVRRLLEESRNRCCLCRKLIDPEQDDPETLFAALEMHHIIMFSEGGEHTVENLLLVCSDCHTKIHRYPERYPIDKLRQAKQHWRAMEGVAPAELVMGDGISDAIRVTFLLKSLNLRYQIAAPLQVTVGDLALFIGWNIMKPLGEYDRRGKWLNPEEVDLNFEGRRGHFDRKLSLAAVPVQTGDVLTARVTQVVEPVVLPPLPFMVGLGEDGPLLRPERDFDRPIWERRYSFEPEMVFVRGGPFWMGSDRRRLERAGIEWRDWMKDELPQHRVSLPGYWIGKYPVTNEEYRAFVEDGGYQTRVYWTAAGWEWKGDRSQPGYWNEERYNDSQQPVVGVVWYEAVAYCRWLSARTGREYRLPSETQWEKAARGTDGRIWPWGNNWDPGKCNNWEKGPHTTTPVGQYSPDGDSPYDCADMVGNVWEWCATKWEGSYENYKGDDDLEGNALRVVRGGSWGDDQDDARCSCRGRYSTGGSSVYGGFRCVSPVA